jgi:hypothetical protein
MEIQIATLCDAATDYDGKLCVLGAFDTILVATVPAVHPQCAIALRFAFRREEEGQRIIRVHFVDEDGHPIVPPLETAIEIKLRDDAFFSTRNLILNFQQLSLARSGLYSVDVSVDGRQEASIPLQVHLILPKK